jgi:hypothetical protein
MILLNQKHDYYQKNKNWKITDCKIADYFYSVIYIFEL